MPLKNCRECNWVVADDAETCPNCGHNISIEGCGKMVAIGLAVLGVFIVLYSASQCVLDTGSTSW